jgi:hypothetical protein
MITFDAITIPRFIRSAPNVASKSTVQCATLICDAMADSALITVPALYRHCNPRPFKDITAGLMVSSFWVRCRKYLSSSFSRR